MTDQHSVPTSATPPNVELKLAPGYHQIYANSVTMRATTWDFLLDFGKLISASGTLVTVESELGVFLSPQQAKALLASLGSGVAEYEKRFGEIHTEPK